METYGVPQDKLRPRASDTPLYSAIGAAFVVMFVLLVAAFSDRLTESQKQVATFALIAWFALMLVGAYILSLRSGMRAVLEKIRRQDRFYLTESALVRHRPDDVDATIGFDQITYMTESPEWLNVRASTGWMIKVPRDVARYDELRATLAKYKPILPEKPNTGLTLLSGALVILQLASLMLMVLTHDHQVRIIAAAVLVGALALQYLVLPLLRLTARKP